MIAAFSVEESGAILKSNVSADRNAKYSAIDPGNDTQDYIFLLSVEETDEYFVSKNARQCEATEAVKAKIEAACYIPEYFNPEYFHCWLRTPGDGGSSTACVSSSGTILPHGNFNLDEEAVRPVMWVDLSA